MIENIAPEQPTEKPEGITSPGLKDAVTTGFGREVEHTVTSEDFTILIPDPSNVQFALADDGVVTIYFTYGDPEILKLKFPTQAEARRATIELALFMERKE